MADNNSIATLKDEQEKIINEFETVDKEFEKFEKYSYSEKNASLRKMKTALDRIKNHIDLMKIEFSDLQETKNQLAWETTINQNKKKYQEYLKKSEEKKENMINKNLLTENNDPEDIDREYNKDNMNIEQAFKRGDKILKEDRNIIDNMAKTVDGDVRVMKDVNIQLDQQAEKLEGADKDLKDIDYSLKRAGKQMTQILKMYATDKIIMCLIVVLLLIIVAVIILGCVKGKNSNSNKGTTDIFS